jgi:hypothetical protein
MNKRVVTFIKGFIYTALIIGLASVLYFDPRRVEKLKLQYRLKWGTPTQKEEVLNIFMETNRVGLVPSVIEAILDDTVSPRHGDTGWRRIHHQAATAMCRFAQCVDGMTQAKRGRNEYSFSHDGGAGTLERRIEVHRNWRQWWDKNKAQIGHRSAIPHRRLPRR